MQQLLHHPLPSVAPKSNDIRSQDLLQVFIAFDDLLAYQRALHTIEHVALQLGDEFEVRPLPCPFDVIESESSRTLAADEVSRSEIVVISSSSAGPLPVAIRDWLQVCCAARHNSGTVLVAMHSAISGSHAYEKPDAEFLRSLAEGAGWMFLSPEDGKRIAEHFAS